MGLTHVTVRLKNMTAPNGGYEADFLVDTGATDSLAPGVELRKIGLLPVGRTVMNWRMAPSKNMNTDWPRSLSWVK